MQFCCLGSGSKGNTTLVKSNNHVLMIDCGFSVRDVFKRLAAKDCDPVSVKAILVTHEHSDHIAGVAALARKLSIPVYASRGTAKTGKLEGVSDMRWIVPGQRFTIAGVDVDAVTVPHDACEPCQFVLQANGRRLGVATDMGFVSAHVLSAYRQCDAMLLEANHDTRMLWQGPYPPSLKHRVAGNWGHLSNEQARQFISAVDTDRLSTLVLGHISEQNNCVSIVRKHFDELQNKIGRIVYASQDDGFDWLAV